jgi:hypothetical protein
MRTIKHLVLSVFAASVFSCSSTAVTYDKTTSKVEKSGFAITVTKVWKKTKSPVFLTFFENNTEKFVVIPYSQIECGDENSKGQLEILKQQKTSDYMKFVIMSAEKTLTLSPGENIETKVVCKGGSGLGKAFVKIKNAYSRESQKGDTSQLAVFAKDIVWMEK